MPDWFDTLTRSLDSAGWPATVWEAGGARLLIVPRAARVLACRLPGVEGSIFWHDPRLADRAKAHDVMASGCGSGGDRLWIAPESAFMWEDLARDRHNLSAAAVLPPEMDPGDYRVVAQSPGHLHLSAEMSLRDHRTRKRLTVRVARRFDLIGPPEVPLGEACSVGFAIQNDLTMLEADPGAVAGVWNLLQLPPTGTLTCPTVAPLAPPRSYYAEFGPRHVRAGESAVSFLIDARHGIKMGLGPGQTTGRMAYYRRAGKLSTLIVRLFLPQPGQTYIDLPVDEVLQGRHTGGDALQAYNSPGDGSGCGEMEYHEPALVAGQTPESRSGTSVTHCLAGPDADIRRVGRLLLGVELTELT